MNDLNAKKTYSRFGLTYTIGQLGYTVVVIILTLILGRIRPDILSSVNANLIITYAILVCVAYPAMYLAIRNLKKTAIPKKKMGIGLYLCCFPMAYALAAAANIVGSVVNMRLGEITGEGSVNPVIDLMMKVSPVVLTLVAVILAPLCEELTFRKFLIDRTICFGEKTAMVMSGIIFGLYHGNLSQFAYAFVLGMFFAFIYIRTGKIIYTILLHMFINGSSTLLSQVLKSSIDFDKIVDYLYSGDMEGYTEYAMNHMSDIAIIALIGMIIITFLILGIVLVILNHNKFVLMPVEEQLEKGHVVKNVIGNVGMIIFLVYTILNMIIAQCGLDRNIAAFIAHLFSR
jgi:membrane protease YdiL (CAAX protease family)